MIFLLQKSNYCHEISNWLQKIHNENISELTLLGIIVCKHAAHFGAKSLW